MLLAGVAVLVVLRSAAGPNRTASGNPDDAFVVASLTTTPTRLPLMEDVLVSLRAQSRPVDALVLNLPDRYSQDDSAYPESIPQRIASLAHVHRCGRDWGPATKLIPTVRWLAAQRSNSTSRAAAAHLSRTFILIVDDDHTYPPRMVETLLPHVGPRSSVGAKGLSAVLQGAGRRKFIASFMSRTGALRPVIADLKDKQIITPAGGPPVAVDILEAYAGWLIPAEALLGASGGLEAHFERVLQDSTKHTRVPTKAALRSDDLTISAYLDSLGVGRFQVAAAHYKTTAASGLPPFVADRPPGDFWREAQYLHRRDAYVVPKRYEVGPGSLKTFGGGSLMRYIKLLRAGVVRLPRLVGWSPPEIAYTAA